MLKKINILRRKITKLFTKNIGKIDYPIIPIEKAEIKKILICRPNHRLGNQILLASLIQELEQIFPNCKIDLFVKGNLSKIIYKNYDSIDTIILLPKKHFKNLVQYLHGWIKLRSKKYDLAINVINYSSSGRLSTKFSNAKYKFYGDTVTDNERNSDIHIAKSIVYRTRDYLSKIGVKIDHDDIFPLDLRLDKIELEQGKKIINDLSNNAKKIISIFTFATGDKCYSEEWWLKFYGTMKKQFEDYVIIEILPVENVSQINFEAPYFYSKDIREIAGVIANTAIFVGADSGMMHLASASKTPTLGLFKVTNRTVYEPFGNKNKGIDTNEKTFDELIQTIKNILA